jgi:molybdopterin synthase catalytic subunit
LLRVPASVVRLQAQSFDPGEETNTFVAALDNSGAGAVVTFTGLVRSDPNHPIESLTLEHYPALAQSQLESIAARALQRFELLGLTLIHRFGNLLPGEPIVQVMALAPHRGNAFQGAQFVMDYLKTDAPFWKKEHTKAGGDWVQAKSIDDKARAAWE